MVEGAKSRSSKETPLTLASDRAYSLRGGV
jgi:hypothetical protein